MQAVAADATVPLLSCAAAIFIWCIFTAISRPRILLAGLGLGLTGVAAQEFFNEPMRVPLQAFAATALALVVLTLSVLYSSPPPPRTESQPQQQTEVRTPQNGHATQLQHARQLESAACQHVQQQTSPPSASSKVAGTSAATKQHAPRTAHQIPCKLQPACKGNMPATQLIAPAGPDIAEPLQHQPGPHLHLPVQQHDSANAAAQVFMHNGVQGAETDPEQLQVQLSRQGVLQDEVHASSDDSSPWLQLPEDVFILIMQQLGPECTSSVRATCLDWHARVKRNSTVLSPRRMHPNHIVALFPNLKSLNLGACSEGCRPSRLRPLRQLRHLTSLSIGPDTRGIASIVSDRCAVELGGFTGLAHLGLAHCVHIGDRGFMALGALTNLTSLDLSGCVGVTNVGLILLSSNLRRLANLELSWCLKITCAGLKGLAASAERSLTGLNISGCQLVGEVGFGALGGLTKLQRLAATNLGIALPAVTDASLAKLSSLAGLTSLSIGGLSSTGCMITDAGLAALPRQHPNLAELKVQSVDTISDAGLTAVIAGFRSSLTSLHVRGCARISSRIFSHLTQLTGLTSLDLLNCHAMVIRARHICHLVNSDASLPSPAASPGGRAAAASSAASGSHQASTQMGGSSQQGSVSVAQGSSAGSGSRGPSASAAAAAAAATAAAPHVPAIPPYVPPGGSASIASLVAASQAAAHAAHQAQQQPPVPPAPPLPQQQQQQQQPQGSQQEQPEAASQQQEAPLQQQAPAAATAPLLAPPVTQPESSSSHSTQQQHNTQQPQGDASSTSVAASPTLLGVQLKPAIPLTSLTLGSATATAAGSVLDDLCIAQLIPVSQTLQSLCLTSFQGSLTGAGAPAALAALTALTNLEFHGAAALGEAGLAALWSSGVMSRLHSFSLSHTSSATQVGLLQMLGNKATYSPGRMGYGKDYSSVGGMAGSGIAGTAVMPIEPWEVPRREDSNFPAVHNSCPALTSLTLSMCGMAVTDRVLTAVAAAAPRLAQLACVQATAVSDYGLRALTSLSRLTLLDLSLCQRITGEGLGPDPEEDNGSLTGTHVHATTHTFPHGRTTIVSEIVAATDTALLVPSNRSSADSGVHPAGGPQASAPVGSGAAAAAGAGLSASVGSSVGASAGASTLGGAEAVQQVSTSGPSPGQSAVQPHTFSRQSWQQQQQGTSPGPGSMQPSPQASYASGPLSQTQLQLQGDQRRRAGHQQQEMRGSRLHSLMLACCGQVTDSGLAALAQHHTSLTRLELAQCANITDEGIRHLAALTNLTGLDLCYCSRLGDASCSVFASLPLLATLKLQGCVHITDAGITDLAKRASCLLTLHMDKCIGLTDVGVKQIAEITTLTSLRLARVPELTDEGVSALSKLTRLSTLSLAHCFHITEEGILALSTLTSLASLEH